ncbi:protein of unknown function [Paraburkholderia dioscoreae]|uniref:Uncharacterized protein n=1 Tax=Paraburkholderia dioscoreae TaxID=2604047 RepID=A0A5Q4Z3N4_9BURK|nr:protein of unknown function [Paraburkholderia dioscoreae]
MTSPTSLAINCAPELSEIVNYRFIKIRKFLPLYTHSELLTSHWSQSLAECIKPISPLPSHSEKETLCVSPNIKKPLSRWE